MGYHSAVRGSGPPSLHPSNEPEPQTLIPAMMCPLAAHRLKRIAISSKRLIPFFPTHDANDQSLAYVYGRETKRVVEVALRTSERLDVTNWIALIILALGAVLLILNESGMIAGLDTATFGYVAMFSALIVYLSGGMVGSYKGRRDALVRDMLIWLALGLGIVILYIFAQRRGFSF